MSSKRQSKSPVLSEVEKVLLVRVKLAQEFIHNYFLDKEVIDRDIAVVSQVDPVLGTIMRQQVEASKKSCETIISRAGKLFAPLALN